MPHQHPFLVFDGRDRLHQPLTLFAKESAKHVSEKTTRVYLRAVLAFFSFLDQDAWQVRASTRWDSPPERLREAVTDYLSQNLQCKVREHPSGFRRVFHTSVKRSTVGVFLSGLKLFYRVMSRRGLYPHDNPLIDVSQAALVAAAGNKLIEGDGPPPMPERSGVQSPSGRPDPKRRLSDSFFKLDGERWIPQVIDDPEFRQRVLEGGKLAKWRMREDVVTSLLFDTGARISEVVGQTLGDWYALGMRREATAFSKGSHGRRVKFLRFSNGTARLLRRYFNGDRRKCDPRGFTISQYLRLAEGSGFDLYTVPIFLTTRKTALTPQTFRDVYWNRACEAAGLVADVHQIRHWFVTRMVRAIHDGASSDGDVECGLRALIGYMGWRSGWETLEAYDHYFDPQRIAEAQDRLHAQMGEELKLVKRGGRRMDPRSLVSGPQGAVTLPTPTLADPEFDFLRRLGD